jgi:Xaa-Pro aminopeptidase
MRLDNSVLLARIAEVENQIETRGLQPLLVYATGSALGPGSRTHGYMRYLCDWDSHHAPSVLILRSGASPVLLVPNLFMAFLAERYFWMRDVRFVKISDFPREVAALLKQSNLAKGRAGLVGRNEMPAPVWEGLKDWLPDVDWEDFTHALDERRVIKDRLQMSLHERAAEICDDLFITLAREIRTPKPGFQLQADMERTARCAGCEYCITWLTVLPKADYPRYFKEECQRVPQLGDQVIAGVSLIYEGHWGHAVRSGTFGAPNEGQRKVFDIALEMEETMLGLLKPGTDLFDLQEAAEKIVFKHYPDADERKIIRARHGHGLGLSYEDPISSLPFPQVYDKSLRGKPTSFEVKVGMLFEFHPNLFVPNVAGAMIGDMVTVTTHGARILNRFPRELIRW